jgi:hypothetical protein
MTPKGYLINSLGGILYLTFIVKILFINTLSESEILGALGKVNKLEFITDISLGIELY